MISSRTCSLSHSLNKSNYNIMSDIYNKVNLVDASKVFFLLYTCNFHSMPHWLPIILIILSNDVHLNPDPQFQNNVFNFMSWNVRRSFNVFVLEAHYSIFNYDLISIRETSVNDTVELPGTLLNGYNFAPANNPANIRNGGVGLFYKDSLPVIVRYDLSFDESIVVKLKFGRNIFLTIPMEY